MYVSRRAPDRPSVHVDDAEAVGRLPGLRQCPTAVFAEIDQIAREAIRTLRRGGIEVPERMSVLGFDDHEMAEGMDLSTVAQSPADFGRTAGELTRSLIDDPDAERAPRIEMPTHLIRAAAPHHCARRRTTPRTSGRPPRGPGRPRSLGAVPAADDAASPAHPAAPHPGHPSLPTGTHGRIRYGR
ncbi:substrate-binding domain-containing protein [Streptomyces sp. NPDC101393]|uniref:substrate-binding domain-containing protein n=1 Tax=Streptomyces sp. NPDC101393 TaxID=3366141 RepID=UPI003809815E